MKESRKSPRVAISRGVVFSLPDGQEYRATAFNLSTSGIAIQSPIAIGLGTEISLHFYLEVHDNKYEINTNAKVMHGYLRNDVYALGLDFVDLNEEQQAWLEEFVEFRMELRDG